MESGKNKGKMVVILEGSGKNKHQNLKLVWQSMQMGRSDPNHNRLLKCIFKWLADGK